MIQYGKKFGSRLQGASASAPNSASENRSKQNSSKQGDHSVQHSVLTSFVHTWLLMKTSAPQSGKWKPCRGHRSPPDLFSFLSKHQKMSRIWLTKCLQNYDRNRLMPHANLHKTYITSFVITYLLFWPAFIWRSFLAKKNSAGCLLKNKVEIEKIEHCNLTRRFWQHMDRISNLTQCSTWLSIRTSTKFNHC